MTYRSYRPIRSNALRSRIKRYLVAALKDAVSANAAKRIYSIYGELGGDGVNNPLQVALLRLYEALLLFDQLKADGPEVDMTRDIHDTIKGFVKDLKKMQRALERPLNKTEEEWGLEPGTLQE
jgi:hypothetical protein